MYDDLALFIRIIENGSLSATAKLLNIPAPTLTRRLQHLEQSLGYRLLHRNARRLIPTEEGWQYYEQCRPLVQALEQATQSLDTALSQTIGCVRVLAPTNLAGGILRTLWADFLQSHPAIQLELLLSNELENLLARRADLAIRVGPQADSLLKQKKLGEIPTLLVASPAYLDERGYPKHPKELSSHDLILAQPLQQWVLKLFDSKERYTVPITQTPRVRTNDIQLATEMAASDLGITYCPLLQAYDGLKSGKLIRVLPEWTGDPRPVYMVWPQQHYLPARVQVFMQTLQQFAQTNPLLNGVLWSEINAGRSNLPYF